MQTRHDHLDLTAILVMIACCTCWGLNQVTIKVANVGISPLMQAGLRGAGAGLLVLLWSTARGIRVFERDGSLGVGSLLGLVFAVEFMMLYWGVTFTTASRAIIFVYLAPFVVAIGAHLWIPGERLGFSQVAGLIAAFAGMLVAFGDALRLPSLTQLMGDLLVVGSAILWGVTTIMVKTTRLARIPPSKSLLYQLAGSALLLPLSPLVGESGITKPDLAVIAALAYSTIGVAFVSYLAWYWLIVNYPATKLSGFSFLAPMIGVIAGGLLLGEPLSAALWAALALVALGIYLINRRPRVAVGVERSEQQAL
jgi:drug/metabolite transporter (DMT)-like permease